MCGGDGSSCVLDTVFQRLHAADQVRPDLQGGRRSVRRQDEGSARARGVFDDDCWYQLNGHADEGGVGQRPRTELVPGGASAGLDDDG